MHAKPFTNMLNFVKPRRWFQRPWLSSRWDVLFAVLVFLLAVWIWHQHQQYAAENARWQARLVKVKVQPSPMDDKPVSAIALAEIQQIHADLGADWQGLYQALEQLSVRFPTVHFVRVTPQFSQHKLELTVETAQYETFTPWMQALSQQTGLTQVSLMRHQWQADDDAGHFVAEIHAGWQP